MWFTILGMSERTSRVARTPRAGWPSGHTRGRQHGHVGVPAEPARGRAGYAAKFVNHTPHARVRFRILDSLSAHASHRMNSVLLNAKPAKAGWRSAPVALYQPTSVGFAWRSTEFIRWRVAAGTAASGGLQNPEPHPPRPGILTAPSRPCYPTRHKGNEGGMPAAPSCRPESRPPCTCRECCKAGRHAAAPTPQSRPVNARRTLVCAGH